jgi:hypothetical protein
MNKSLAALVVALTLLCPAAYSKSPATQSFTEPNIKNFIRSWYRSTNDHRPKEELLAFLDERVEFLYPNHPKPLVGKRAFLDWYADALVHYFDETHTIERWKSFKIEGDTATVSVVVRWEYRTWKPGDAKSEYHANIAHQRWEIRRDPADGRFKIVKKAVESFESTAPIYAVAQ